MTHEREGRAERVELDSIICTGATTGNTHPGLAFGFYNYLNDRLAEVEFVCTPSMLLDFVAAVQRAADIATSEAMAENDRAQADAN